MSELIDNLKDLAVVAVQAIIVSVLAAFCAGLAFATFIYVVVRLLS